MGKKAILYNAKILRDVETGEVSIQPDYGDEQVPLGGGSWNDMKDRPFGEVILKDTLLWDGNTDNKLTTADGTIVQVSDAVPTLEDLANGGEFQMSNDFVMNFNGEELEEVNGVIVLFDLILIATQDDVTLFDSVYIPVKGVYFSKFSDDAFTCLLKINDYNGFETKSVQYIDTKYVEPFKTSEDLVFNWDGVIGDRETMGSTHWVHITDYAPTLEEFANGFTVIDNTGGVNEYNPAVFADTPEGFMHANNQIRVVPVGHKNYAAGIYFWNGTWDDERNYTQTVIIKNIPKLKPSALPKEAIEEVVVNVLKEKGLISDK